MVETLVLSGGSLRGIAYIGLLKYLDEIGAIHRIKTVIGTSVGSLIGFLLILGYNYKELYQIIININGNKFQNLNIDFLNQWGLDDGSKIMKVLMILLRRKTGKETITFNELFQQTHKNLIIVGTCLNTMDSVYFSDKTTPNMDVLQALRISVSIPFMFKPVIYDNKYYVDGAITNNFPIDNLPNNNKKTMAVLLYSKSYEENQIETFEHYFFSIMNSVMVHKDKEKMEKYFDITIKLDVECNSLDFSLSKDIKENIFHQGYLLAKSQIDKKFNYLVKNLLKPLLKP